MGKIIVNSDGGARGNPGPAAIGVVIDVEGKKHEISKCIGDATNNQAEYQAVIEALKFIQSNLENRTPGVRENGLEIECLLDSELVVEQLNGRYKIKNEGLKPLFLEIRNLIIAIGGDVTFKHIRREQNKKADELVNKALDEAK